LSRCSIDDPMPSMTKRHRLFEALRSRQMKDDCANNVLAFIQTAWDPVRFHGKYGEFEDLRGRLNEVLCFGGLHVAEDGKLRAVNLMLGSMSSRALSLQRTPRKVVVSS
jgi:hypothetical protein